MIRRLPSNSNHSMDSIDKTSNAAPSRANHRELPGGEIPQNAYAASYTSDVTKRMLRIGRRRYRKRRIVFALLTCCIVAVSIVVIVQIANMVAGDLPLSFDQIGSNFER